MLSGLVHTSGVQSLLHIPNVGKHLGLDTGPLIHSFGAWICTVRVGNVYWESEAGRRTIDLGLDLVEKKKHKPGGSN